MRHTQREICWGIVLACAVLGLLNVSPAQAATFNVNKTADTADGTCDADCSLREAILAANAAAGADTITLPAGTYTLTIAGVDEDASATGDLDITDDLTINGAGAGTTIIQACDSSGGPCVGIDRVIHIPTSTVGLSGVTIRNGNVTSSGGGIFGSTGSSLTLTNSTVTGNTAFDHGGGILIDGALTLTGSTVSNNTANSDASGDGNGGGIYIWPGNNTVTLTNSTISGNSAFFGGGYYTDGSSSVTLTDSTISGNTSSSTGGGIFHNGGTLTLTNTAVSSNTAGASGGGIRLSGGVTASLTGSTVNGNLSSGTNNGGGIHLLGVGTTATLTDSVVSGNTAYRGGGIYNEATLTLTGSTVSGNTATQHGGGIINDGTLTAINTTLSGNMANIDAGGLYNAFSGLASTASLNNVTITNNTADSDSNSSGDGGGVFAVGTGTVNLKNTILGGNTGGTAPDCAGTLTSQDYNLIQSTAGCTISGTTTNNITGVSPNLGALANNGGSTQTHALLSGSPAIDAGNPAVPGSGGDACAATDQRGTARPQDGNGDGTVACDIGAYEGLGPNISLSTPSISFGSVTAGNSSAPQTVTVSNTGVTNLVIGTITITGADPSDFTKSNDACSGQTVAPLANCTVDVAFSPSTTGSKSAGLSIPSNDSDTPTATVALSGTGTAAPVPDIAVTDSVAPTSDLQIPFGNVMEGNVSDQTVTITNNGNADLTIGTVASANPLTAPFGITVDTCSGQTIAPARSCALTARFAPTSTGGFTDSFDIPNNDPDTPTVTMSVSGTGLSSVVNNPPAAPVLVFPTDGQTGLPTTVTFRWQAATDPDGDTVTYLINYCTNSGFTSCSPVDVASLGVGLILFGVVASGLWAGRKRVALLAITMICIGTLLIACGGDGGDDGGSPPAPTNEVSYTVSGLSPSTTYYWKVIVDDGNGGSTESAVFSFTTQ
jgi:CSLREA domain-containing protein